MINIRKRLVRLGYKFADPSASVDVSGPVINFPRRAGCDREPPADQPPSWEASYARGACPVYDLHPMLLYSDLNNLPFDIGEECMKEWRRDNPDP